MSSYRVIGSAIGCCGLIDGCEDSPQAVIQKLMEFNPHLQTDIIKYSGAASDVNDLANFFTVVANKTYTAIKENSFPILLGGDHSCAIGSWSGIASQLQQNGQDLGLIWVDAHLDSHRPETSESGNLHGMPVAHLLGRGFDSFKNIITTTPKLKPENIVYFGIRCYEAAEREFLESLNVKIYYQDALNSQNFTAVFLQEFNELATRTNNNVGISFDLDALDPDDIAAVGTPVEKGIRASEFLHAFKQLDLHKLIALEIAEYNPHLDKNSASLNYIIQLLRYVLESV